MSEAQAPELRFRLLFTWGGVIVALLGLVFAITGNWRMGVLLIVAGMVFWLFAKRRTRRTGQ